MFWEISLSAFLWFIRLEMCVTGPYLNILGNLAGSGVARV